MICLRTKAPLLLKLTLLKVGNNYQTIINFNKYYWIFSFFRKHFRFTMEFTSPQVTWPSTIKSDGSRLKFLTSYESQSTNNTVPSIILNMHRLILNLGHPFQFFWVRYLGGYGSFAMGEARKSLQSAWDCIEIMLLPHRNNAVNLLFHIFVKFCFCNSWILPCSNTHLSTREGNIYFLPQVNMYMLRTNLVNFIMAYL